LKKCLKDLEKNIKLILHDYLAVMPLPCQVAQTALTRQRKDSFAVLTLSLQDYQKHWQSSSKTRQAVPVYGFIDYRQQLIVLLNQ
jgi:hypothetical protein